MTSLARTICTLFAVAVLAAMNLHGVTQSQHKIAHAADWPAVSLIQTAGGHDHPDAHIHVAPDDVPDADDDRNSDPAQPMGHHHHGGGDNQTATLDVGRAITEAPPLASSTTAPSLGRPLSNLIGDGPDYPPKRMRTVV